MALQATETVKEILAARGYNFAENNSSTDFGDSDYLYVYTTDPAVYRKVRISDHSVSNQFRMSQELHISINSPLFDFAVNRSLDILDTIFFPELFEEKEVIELNKVTIEVRENCTWESDEIVGERIAKSGNKHLTVNRTYRNSKKVLVRK